MTLIPFTVHFKIVPFRGDVNNSPSAGAVVVRKGGRYESRRSLEKIASKIYQALEDYNGTETDPVILPKPGGGQSDTVSWFSGLNYGCAVKPQFGNEPALAMIEGFYDTGISGIGASKQHAADTMVFHSGEIMTGPKGPGPNFELSDDDIVEFNILKTSIEAAIVDVNDASVIGRPTIYRMLYKGVTWGNRGFTFPL